MDATKERELAQRIEQGDEEAKIRMVEAHLWLADYLARRYYGLGLPFEDLRQEGVVALFKAIENFDYRKGRFSTHASFWIRQQMTRAIFAESLIKLPIPICEEIRTGKRDLNSVPTIDFSLTWHERLVDKRARPNGKAIKNVSREQLKIFLQDCLSKKEFLDVWYHFEEGWSILKIAKARGVSKQTVAANIKNALQKLQRSKSKNILQELLEDS